MLEVRNVPRFLSAQVFDIGYNQFSGSVTCDLAASTSPLMEFHINDNKVGAPSGSVVVSAHIPAPESSALCTSASGFDTRSESGSIASLRSYLVASLRLSFRLNLSCVRC